jgi:hypothetical protein
MCLSTLFTLTVSSTAAWAIYQSNFPQNSEDLAILKARNVQAGLEDFFVFDLVSFCGVLGKITQRLFLVKIWKKF